MDWQFSPATNERPARPARRWVTHGSHSALAAPHRIVRPEGFSGESFALSSPAATPPSRLVTLDGSHGEGGGQILRTALALSLLTGRPFRIKKIRANRDKPGLRPQHLKAVEAAASLCGSEPVGASIGSRDLTFRPAPYTPADLTVTIGTAGSTALLLHTLHLPIAMRAQSGVRLVLNGGTFNRSAPSYPFLERTWCGYMSLLGLPVTLSTPAAGFYPKGSGRLEAWIEPGTPRALTLTERPPLRSIRGFAGVSHLDPSIAERMRQRAEKRLRAAGLEPEIDLGAWSTSDPGAAIVLTAEHGAITSSFVGLGERGKPSEAVADEAVDELLAFEESPGALDPHSADQLLLPLALASGPSEYTVTAITNHLRTNAATIQAFLDRPIRIEERADGFGRVMVD